MSFLLSYCSSWDFKYYIERYWTQWNGYRVPDFSGHALSYSSFSMVLAVGLLCAASIMLRYIHCNLRFFRPFIVQGCWNLLVFFCIYWDEHVLSVIKCFYMVDCMYWFTCVKLFLHLWNKPNLILVYFWMLFVSIYWEVFHLCSSGRLVYNFLFRLCLSMV